MDCILLRMPSAERVRSREGPTSGGRETTYTPAIWRPNPSRSRVDTWASACGPSEARAHAATSVSTITRTCHPCLTMLLFSFLADVMSRERLGAPATDCTTQFVAAGGAYAWYDHHVKS